MLTSGPPRLPLRIVALCVALSAVTGLAGAQGVPAGPGAPTGPLPAEGGKAAEEAAPPPADDDPELAASLAGDAPPAPPPPSRAARGGTALLDLGLVLDVAGGMFAGDVLQTGAHDARADGFSLRQLELTAGSVIDPYFRLDVALVFSEHGAEAEEAFATTTGLPGGLQVRAGQFLHRFGRQNAQHPHAWAFVDQPLVVGRLFGDEGGRGPGLELSWLTPLPWYVEVVGTLTTAHGEGTARSFLGAAEADVETPADLLMVYALKQFFPLSDALSFLAGASAAFGPHAAGEGARSELFGVDLTLKHRRLDVPEAATLSLETEWALRHRSAPVEILRDVTGLTQLVWGFTPRWAVAARHEVGTAAGTDAAPDPLDPTWTGARHRWALAVSHRPTEFSLLRLQGARHAGAGQSGWAGVLALEVAAGAHGAHAF